MTAHVSGTEIGKAIGVHHGTWARWVVTAGAPAAVFETGNGKWYDRDAVVEYLDAVASLSVEEAA